MSVILEKGRKVSLQKKGPSMGEILINLNWNQPKKSFFGFSRAIDLDLGCLYEMKDGSKRAVQALGNAFGSLSSPPYIALDGDDRTGASAGGENLRINGAHIDKMKRILVYTFIYEGAANWREANGVVTIKYPGAEDIIIRMDEYSSSMTMCALALFENVGGTLNVEKIVQYYSGHRQMDQAFNWGLRWTPGRK